jgi:hypothetical protein
MKKLFKGLLSLAGIILVILAFSLFVMVTLMGSASAWSNDSFYIPYPPNSTVATFYNFTIPTTSGNLVLEFNTVSNFGGSCTLNQTTRDTLYAIPNSAIINGVVQIRDAYPNPTTYARQYYNSSGWQTIVSRTTFAICYDSWKSVSIIHLNSTSQIGNITFNGINNVTRYLAIPLDKILTNGYFNISGYVPSITTTQLDYTNYTQATTFVDGGGSVQTNKEGMAIDVLGGDILIVSLNKSTLNTATMAYVEDASENVLVNASFVGDTATFNPPYQLNAGTRYILQYDNLGNNYNRRYDNTGISYPVNNSFIGWSGGYYPSSLELGTAYGIISIVVQNYTGTVTGNLSFVNLSIGNGIPLEFNISANGSVIRTVKTNNLNSIINSYLSSCSYTDSYCYLPFTFRSSLSGQVEYSALEFNNIGFGENGQTYNPDSIVGATETFTLNLTYDSSSYVPTINLVYNGVPYLATLTGSGNTRTISKTITVPLSAYNYSFYWDVNLGGIHYNSTTKSQVVGIVTLDNCTTNTYMLYNFTIKDEATKTKINSTSNNTLANLELTLKSFDSGITIFNYSNKFIQTNPFSICLNVPLNQTQYRIDLTMDYVATGYVQKFYYINNNKVNNLTMSQNISLYDLPTADSTTFLFQFTDASGLKVPNGIVHVYRAYLSNGIFNEVERGRMDNNGETHLHLVEEDVIYYFAITLNGDDDVIYTSDNYNAKCLSTPCTLSLTATKIVEPYPTSTTGADSGVNWNIVANATTRNIILTYTSNNSNTNMSMYVYKYSNSGSTFIASDSASGSSGLATVNVPLSYGNTIYLVQVYNNGNYIKPVWIDWKENAQDYFGVAGAVLGGLIVLAIILMAVTEGIVLIVFICLAIVIIWVMQLVDLTWMAVISIITAGGILAWRLWLRR